MDAIDKKKIKRLVDVLTDENISNADKNTALRARIKEIVKSGENGEIIKVVFWE